MLPLCLLDEHRPRGNLRELHRESSGTICARNDDIGLVQLCNLSRVERVGNVFLRLPTSSGAAPMTEQPGPTYEIGLTSAAVKVARKKTILRKNLVGLPAVHSKASHRWGGFSTVKTQELPSGSRSIPHVVLLEETRDGLGIFAEEGPPLTRVLSHKGFPRAHLLAGEGHILQLRSKASDLLQVMYDLAGPRRRDIYRGLN